MPSSVHKDITYHRLICNTIKVTILENTIASPTRDLRLGLLTARIMLEEELYALKTTTLDRPLENRKHSLECAITNMLYANQQMTN